MQNPWLFMVFRKMPFFKVEMQSYAALAGLFLFLPLENTRCLYRTESESQEQYRAKEYDPIGHGVVSRLGQIDFCVGRIRASAGFGVNGVDVQHIAVFIGQRDLIRVL